jgi:CBS domain-containing protein
MKKLEPEITNLISEDYTVVDSEDVISKVLSLLKDEHEKAAVVEYSERIIGVAREKDLVRGALMTNPDETKIKNFLVKTGELNLNNLSPENVTKRFIEDSTPIVLVKLNTGLGVIHIDDFLVEIQSEFSDVEAQSLMNPSVVSIQKNESVSKALAEMREYAISRVVVIDSNQIVGVLTSKDIIERVVLLKKDSRLGRLSKREKEKSLSIMAEGIMSTPAVTAKKQSHGNEIINLMLKNQISSVVIEDNGVPEGIITKKDILEHYLKMLTPGDYDVRISTKNLTLINSELKDLSDDLNRFLKKYRNSTGKSHLFVYVKRLKIYFRKIPLIQVRMKLISDIGTFFVTGEAWGVEFAINVTLKKLERRILKEKGLLLDKRMAQQFYEEVFQ